MKVEQRTSTMRCYGVKEGLDCHMSLHEKPIKANREMISKKKTLRGFQSSLLLYFHPLFLVKLPLHWITNWNPKWLTDSRHHVSTVRTQSSGSLTERVRSHLYPSPSPTAILERRCSSSTVNLTLRITWGIVVLPFSPHLTLVSELDPNNKAPFALRKWTLRKEQGQAIVQTFCGIFFCLVWLAVLQLHLIPTGKPSSGTDFRVPGPGWEKGGTVL